MAVLPLDLKPGAGGDMHLHLLRIIRQTRRWIYYGHRCSIARSKNTFITEGMGLHREKLEARTDLNFLQSLHVVDARNFSDSVNDLLEMFEVGNLQNHINVGLSVRRPGFDVADIRAAVAD